MDSQWRILYSQRSPWFRSSASICACRNTGGRRKRSFFFWTLSYAHSERSFSFWDLLSKTQIHYSGRFCLIYQVGWKRSIALFLLFETLFFSLLSLFSLGVSNAPICITLNANLAVLYHHCTHTKKDRHRRGLGFSCVCVWYLSIALLLFVCGRFIGGFEREREQAIGKFNLTRMISTLFLLTLQRRSSLLFHVHVAGALLGWNLLSSEKPPSVFAASGFCCGECCSVRWTDRALDILVRGVGSRASTACERNVWMFLGDRVSMCSWRIPAVWWSLVPHASKIPDRKQGKKEKTPWSRFGDHHMCRMLRIPKRYCSMVRVRSRGCRYWRSRTSNFESSVLQWCGSHPFGFGALYSEKIASKAFRCLASPRVWTSRTNVWTSFIRIR